MPDIIALHSDGQSTARAAKGGEKKEGKHDILMKFFLLDALFLIFVETTLPTEDGARQAHGEDHDSHENWMTPFYDYLGNADGFEGGVKGCSDLLKEDWIVGQELGGGSQRIDKHAWGGWATWGQSHGAGGHGMTEFGVVGQGERGCSNEGAHGDGGGCSVEARRLKNDARKPKDDDKEQQFSIKAIEQRSKWLHIESLGMVFAEE